MRSLHRRARRPLTAATPRAAQQTGPAWRSARGLGPLETRLLELLWTQHGPVTVRLIRHTLPELAYTTIMTTVDRLFRKGLLRRHRDGRAFCYAVRYTRDELLSELASRQISEALGASQHSAAILSTLVRAVGRADAALLDELQALVQAERRRLKADGP